MSNKKGIQLAWQFLAVLALIVLPANSAFTQKDPPPPTPIADDTLPDWRFPASSERIVTHLSGRQSNSGMCSAMRWTASSQIVQGLFWNYSKHTSKSRDANSSWWACDIDKIGARGRFWVNGSLYDDTGMVTQSNSADITVKTKKTDFTCGNMQARGNHKFEHSGYPSWYPQTDTSC